ncbi:MFS transporter [Peribacillus kribbensis]|uniref:MFS transporter n=1 Tax=Peribacillus kribbensis TaxID=356658 RepID=UPI00041CB8C5|nr:MFS transporter [Peribacillus kribbensis]
MENVKLLKNKQYVYLISSQIVSSIGDWLDLLALMALVSINWKASPMEMTYLMLCLVLPSILFGSFAGVAADKVDRKKIMIFTDIMRAAVVALVVFAPNLWTVYLLIFMKSSFSALFMPAKNGKLKEIVSDEHMQQAVSISSMIDNGSKIIGPMVSGVVVSSFGVHPAFYIDAATFVLSAVLLLNIKKSTNLKNDADSGEKKNFLVEMKAGFSFLKSVPEVLAGLVVMSLSLLVLQIADSQFMILLREIPGIPIDLAGYAMSASGGGMFVMAAILSKKPIKSARWFLSLGAIGVGGGFAVCVLFTGFPILFIKIVYPVLFFIVGIAAASIFIPFNVLAQKSAPVHMSGRVFGTINSVTSSAAVIGMLLGGILVEAAGIKAAFILSGSMLVLIGLASAWVKPASGGSVTVAESERGIQREA